VSQPSQSPAAAALAEAAGVGPYFRLLLDPGDGWLPFSDFAVDGERVSAAIAAHRRRLAIAVGATDAAVEPRVAASLWHLGLTARLVSPALGAAALAGWVPRLDALCWPSEPSSEPERLAIRLDDVTATQVSDADSVAAAIQTGVVHGTLTPLTHTVGEVGSVSEHVLWGNVWSAFAGAATVIAMVRPEAGARAASIVRALVSDAGRPLAGRYNAAGSYGRDTCCLYYRLPQGGLCGDCVLHRIPPDVRQ
jgi:ferric iron reductase protein FhuF